MKATCPGGDRPTRRRVVVMTASLLAVAIAPAYVMSVGSSFAQSGFTSDEEANEIARIQLKADDAAAALEVAEFEAEGLEEELAAAQQEVAAASAVFEQMESTLADVAVRRYMNAGQASPFLLNSDPM